MLQKALKSGLQVFALDTNDPVNLLRLIRWYSKKNVTWVGALSEAVPKNNLSMIRLITESQASKVGAPVLHNIAAVGTIIVVNPQEMMAGIPHIGVVRQPDDFKVSVLVDRGYPEGKAKQAVKALKTAELCEIIAAMELMESNTLASLKAAFRKLCAHNSVLQEVSTADPVYIQPAYLREFIETEKMPFKLASDRRLVPRGMLLPGPPGTGKTAASKALCREWGIPLYRLDASVKDKWVGASEKNLRTALDFVDRAAPCGLLIDEVEKLFSSSHGETTGGSNAGMLALLLWWLQEHESRVFTMMTTNHPEKIPPELIREGRVDLAMEFLGASLEEAQVIVNSTFDSFDLSGDDRLVGNKEVSKLLEKLYSTADLVPQAQVAQAAIRIVKSVRYPKE